MCTLVRIDRSFIKIAAAAFVMEAALFSTLAALLPHYRDEFGMSSLASGVLAGSYTAGMLVGTLLAGLWLNDRFRVRPTALGGAGILAASSLAFGMVDSVWQLDLTRVVQGIGAGILWCSLLNWLILIVAPQSRGAALGAAMGAAVFGTAVGPLLGAATQVVGTFPVFAAVAVAVVALASLLVLADAPPREVKLPGERRLDRLRIPSYGGLRSLAAVGLVPPVVGGAVITLAPLDISDLGASDAGVAVVLLIAALFAAVACPLAGYWADRVGDRTPIIVGLVICCLALGGMAISDSVVELAVAFATYQGVALSVFWIPLMSLFSARGEAAGMSAAGAAIVLNMTISCGYTFGPPAATGLADWGGMAAAYLALAAVSVLTLIFVTRWGGFASAYGRQVATSEAAG